MFLITDMLYFPRRHRTSTCPLGWKLNALILVSRTFKKSSVLQCSRRLPVAITNKNIIHLSFPEMENSVFPDLVLLSCAPAATNSLSCPSLRSSYTATLSSTCFWIFSTQWNPIGWRNWRWKAALEPGSWISLITFTLLVFRTKQGAWHKRIQLMKSFRFPSTRTTNSVRLILGSQYSLCEN